MIGSKPKEGQEILERERDRDSNCDCDVWVCMGMYGYIWVCMGMYGYVLVCMGIYGYIKWLQWMKNVEISKYSDLPLFLT